MASADAPVDQIVALESQVRALKAELRRSEARVEAMKAIGFALGSTLDLDHLLDVIVGQTTRLLDADRSTLFLLDPVTQTLWSKVLEGPGLQEIRMPIGVGIAGQVAESGAAIRLRRPYEDPRFNPEFDRRSGYQTRDLIAVPVRRPGDGVLLGVVQALNKRHGDFDQEDERALAAIASEIGVALEVARLYREAVDRGEALARAQSELSLLFSIERAIASAESLPDLLATILDTALGALRAESGAIHIIEPTSGRLERAAHRGPEAPEDGAKEAAASGDVTHGPGPSIAVPIGHRDSGRLGALVLLGPSERPRFDGEEERTLGLVASQVGRAIFAERRRLARASEERLEAIGQMLAGVVHDLRTPLTLISGYTHLLAEADQRELRNGHAERVERQVAVVDAMTRDLLAFARGERSLFARKVQVHRFVSEMRSVLERELEGSGVSLEVEMGYQGPARFDEVKLRRVFHNLAKNAREAMPRGGKLSIAVLRDGDQLGFRFEDEGPGLPAELAGRLFEPFASAGKASGTGLGLTIVREIAEQHGGRVLAADRAEGGARFELWMPLGLDPAQAPSSASTEA